MWVGIVFMLYLFIIPAVNSMGPDGGKFMQAMAKTKNFPAFISAITGLAILSGIILFAKISGPGFMSTKYGMVLALGAVTGLIAFIIGSFVNRPSLKRIGVIGEEIAKAGSAPSQEQSQEIGRLRGKLASGIKWMTLLLTISLLAMTSAKFI